KRSIRVRNDLLLSCIELGAGSGMLRYEFDGFSEAAETYYGIVRQAAAYDRQYDTLRRRLAAELKKSKSTLGAVEADLRKFGDPERLNRYGDLILANISTARVEKGNVKVRDYYEPGEPEIEIDIEESPSLQRAASRFYERYQKAQRAEKTLAPRVRALKDRI